MKSFIRQIFFVNLPIDLIQEDNAVTGIGDVRGGGGDIADDPDLTAINLFDRRLLARRIQLWTTNFDTQHTMQ